MPRTKNTVVLDDVVVTHDDYTQAIWRRADHLVEGGHDDGRITIRLNVDGDMTIAYHDLGDSDPIDAISAAMGALTELLQHHLSIAAAVPLRRGRCLTWEDYRCRLRAGHPIGEHDFEGKEPGSL